MQPAASDNEYRQRRMENMAALEALGHAPFGRAFERTGDLADIRAAFEEGRAVRAAGRIVALRDMGRSVFAHLQDGSDRFQVYLRRGEIDEAAFAGVRHLDLGDHLGVEGTLFTTRTGEPTIKVARWTLLAKALRPPPEKFHGLQDVELRHRRRYLDLVANPESRRVFRARAALVRELRARLHARGFEEVETPMLQPLAGGAAARPFETFYHALQRPMFLRIAPELYLKRLLVGGMDRVFELNRNFRNEGLDRSHNPEFTMLEVYEAYGNATSMRALVQDLVLGAAEAVNGSRTAGTAERPVDLEPPWREVAYAELLHERLGNDWPDVDLPEARRRVEALGLAVEPQWDRVQLGHEVYEKIVEKSLRDPTFVTRFPAGLIPLARRCEDDPGVVDVFELVIDGREIAPGYTELNDPLEQRRRFEAQAGEDGEKIDEDFLLALEYGMPPAGGMGLGVDRLAMILAGVEAIRDVILFPQLRAEG